MPPDLDAVQKAARAVHLDVAGAFHPNADHGCPAGTGTLILLSPQEPAFWPAFTASAEFGDGAPDPMDRWSARVIGKLAEDLGATPLFPFGGPPFHPFYAWALASGRAWASPVRLLVHDSAGLFASYRGALAVPNRLELPVQNPQNPCKTCQTQPCLSACPVSALGANGYDVPACRAYIAGSSGRDCVESGCAVRRACPISQHHGRLPAQSAFHMKAFQ
ncbi:MAG: ferredoxin [Rhodobacterales bacterium 34-62-10]|nr:MAG: ferredoxin [Rhodobacterales bacterium 34-62-10]